MEKKKKKSKLSQGFVLWFTGFSQSGKSTLADRVYEILKKRGVGAERLDGDIIRRSLSSDLGFSKKDRDKNIERVIFVAKILSRNEVAVLCSFISPYRKPRDRARKEVTNFIEVFCNAPLEACEKRDRKGLYKKARTGQIQNFTGVSDLYQKPKNPEIELQTGKESIEKCVERIVGYLRWHKFI